MPESLFRKMHLSFLRLCVDLSPNAGESFKVKQPVSVAEESTAEARLRESMIL